MGSGKTSQSTRLLSYLEGLGHPVESWRFPDRNTGVGQMISSYLANESQLDDHAIHLLFSANRWVKRSVILYYKHHDVFHFIKCLLKLKFGLIYMQCIRNLEIILLSKCFFFFFK